MSTRILESSQLQNKVVIVTGGGQGLGAATCELLAADGAIVVVTDLNKERADCVCKKIEKAGGYAESMHIDVSDDKIVRSVIADVVSHYPQIDVLINNAGIDVTAPFVDLSVEHWDKIVGVNLRGPFLMAHAVFPMMKERGRGHIVNIVSTAAKRAWSNATAYHATKWGLLGFSHALHVEGRRHKVKVTAILAGGMRTPFLLERFPDLDVNTLQDPGNVAATIRFVLMQPAETVIPEVTVLPLNESSWP
jgi:NAD(P)-dependent dehydrogenase (short-subunit alcohol dehydrogenase family)